MGACGINGEFKPLVYSTFNVDTKKIIHKF